MYFSTQEKQVWDRTSEAIYSGLCKGKVRRICNSLMGYSCCLYYHTSASWIDRQYYMPTLLSKVHFNSFYKFEQHLFSLWKTEGVSCTRWVTVGNKCNDFKVKNLFITCTSLGGASAFFSLRQYSDILFFQIFHEHPKCMRNIPQFLWNVRLHLVSPVNFLRP